MGEYGREQRNRLCKAIINNEFKSRQLKRFVDNRISSKIQLYLSNLAYCNAIQRVQVANLINPLSDDGRAFGTQLHNYIQQNYILNGNVASHHTKVYDMHLSYFDANEQKNKTVYADLGIKDNTSTPVQYGEIKPTTSITAGRGQMNFMRTEFPRLTPINDSVWSTSVSIPLAPLFQGIYIPASQGVAANHTPNLVLAQDPSYPGLYLYSGA